MSAKRRECHPLLQKNFTLLKQNLILTETFFQKAVECNLLTDDAVAEIQVIFNNTKKQSKKIKSIYLNATISMYSKLLLMGKNCNI